MFFEKLLNLCNKNNTTPTAVCIALNLSPAAATKWRSGATPRDTTILKIANHFNVPISYFYKLEQSSDTESNTRVSESATTNSNEKNTDSLGDVEKELVNICKVLDMKRKNALLTKAYELEQEFLSEAYRLNPKNDTPDTVTLFVAAKSSDNHPPQMIEMPREQWNRINSAPETDEDLL